MTRYIDADALKEFIESAYRPLCDDYHMKDYVLNQILTDIKNAPTVDAVEVIRCKDCQHFQPHKGRYQTWRIVSSDGICKNHNYEAVRQNNYCSCAEREDK